MSDYALLLAMNAMQILLLLTVAVAGVVALVLRSRDMEEVAAERAVNAEARDRLVWIATRLRAQVTLNGLDVEAAKCEAKQTREEVAKKLDTMARQIDGNTASILAETAAKLSGSDSGTSLPTVDMSAAEAFVRNGGLATPEPTPAPRNP